MNEATTIGFALLVIAILHFNPICAWAGMGKTASAVKPCRPTKSIPIPDDCAKLASACMNARPLQALPVAETSNAGGEIASLGFPPGSGGYLRPATPVPPLSSASDLSINSFAGVIFTALAASGLTMEERFRGWPHDDKQLKGVLR